MEPGLYQGGARVLFWIFRVQCSFGFSRVAPSPTRSLVFFPAAVLIVLLDGGLLSHHNFIVGGPYANLSAPHRHCSLSTLFLVTVTHSSI